MPSHNHLWLKCLSLLEQSVVVNELRLWISVIELPLPEDGGSADFSGSCMETMRQMTTLRQVKTHHTAAWRHQSCVNLEIGGRSRQRLHIDCPLLCIKSISLKCSLLAKSFNLINVLISTVVAGARVPLTILIRQATSIHLKHSLIRIVLTRHQFNAFVLASLLIHDDVVQLGVVFLQTQVSHWQHTRHLRKVSIGL